MPQDLVCKFPGCISVGSCQDLWRINGPARMKGRTEKERGMRGEGDENTRIEGCWNILRLSRLLSFNISSFSKRQFSSPPNKRTRSFAQREAKKKRPTRFLFLRFLVFLSSLHLLFSSAFLLPFQGTHS